MLISLSRKSRRTGKPPQGGVGLESLSSTKVSVPLLHRLCVTARLVSMVDGGLFDKLDKIGRRIRGNQDEPFGGIQVRMGPHLFNFSDQRNQVACRHGGFLSAAPC